MICVQIFAGRKRLVCPLRLVPAATKQPCACGSTLLRCGCDARLHPGQRSCSIQIDWRASVGRLRPDAYVHHSGRASRMHLRDQLTCVSGPSRVARTVASLPTGCDYPILRTASAVTWRGTGPESDLPRSICNRCKKLCIGRLRVARMARPARAALRARKRCME